MARMDPFRTFTSATVMLAVLTVCARPVTSPTGATLLELVVQEGPYARKCAASAVSPHWLITARHCVRRVVSDQHVTTCVPRRGTATTVAATTFGDQIPIGSIVARSLDRRDEWAVVEVREPPGDAFCGNDVALVRVARSMTGHPGLRVARQASLSHRLTCARFVEQSDSMTTFAAHVLSPDLTVRGRAQGLLTEREFGVHDEMMPGDSGAPCFAGQQLVGVLSRRFTYEGRVAVFTDLRAYGAWVATVVASDGS